MTTIYYSVTNPHGYIVMYNPNPFDLEKHRRTYIGYSLREAKQKFKALLGITKRVHWEEV